ncbi:pyruvate synthase subunit PorD [Chloroflexota bacterium]
MTKRDDEITWRDIGIGAIVTEPGSARQYKTGAWRSQRPTYDFNKCIKCGVCYLFCPEGCIGQNNEGHFEADMDYCKGCGICAHECPTGVITMKEEEEE